MYRNAYYNPFEGTVFLRTWSSEGVRVDTEVDYRPFLFVEEEDAKDATSIFKTPLKKKCFRNTFERRKFADKAGTNRLFYNLPADQQFLIECFQETNNDLDFAQFPLKIFYLDIETDSSGAFPVPDKAADPINLITIYDSLSQQFYTWGLSENEFKPTKKNSKYYSFTSEHEMLVDFVEFWRKDFPDVVSGWSSEFFDIPYIVNRMNRVVADDFANRLSPVGRTHFRKVYGSFGKEQGKWLISGVSCLDYLELYKTFSLGERGSYKLNDIAELELGEGKVAFNAISLSQLANSDWNTFVEYNIQDVNLLVKLEEKLKYLQIARLLAYKGCTNFESALGKVAIVTGAVAVQALRNGFYVPTFKGDKDRESYPGGYVKDPERGLHKAMVTFDVNSLYPNTIITLNISPETKVGKIVTGYESGAEDLTLQLVNGKSHNIKRKHLFQFLDEEGIALSKAGVLYTQKRKGVIPQLIESLYKERSDAKSTMIALKKDLQKLKKSGGEVSHIETQITWNDTLNATLKVLLNSVYGVFANKHSALMDIDNASSITMTGQEVAKAGASILDEAVRTKYSVNPPFVVVAQDTDSVMITIDSVLKSKQIPLLDEKGVITKACHEIVDELDRTVNKGVIEWAKRELNTKDPRYIFKREAIADVGLFLQKKRYILHILDNEGVAEEKFKYVGIELARSTIPAKVKKLIKQITDTALLTQDKSKTVEAYVEAYDKFVQLEPNDLAIRSTANNIREYGRGASLARFNLKTPYHIKAALAYNFLVDELKLGDKYEKIEDGQKVRLFYVDKNKYGLEAIAFPNTLPPEFGLKPDFDEMFETTVQSSVDRIFEATGWNKPSIKKRVQTDLFDFFGVD